MVSQAAIKRITALKVKKYRQKYRKFTAEGEKIVRELLGSAHVWRVEAVYGLSAWAESNAVLLAAARTPFFPVSEAELGKLSAFSTPNKVLAVVDMPEPPPADPPLTGFAFFLDGLQDPANLGAVWRVADWFGMPALYASPDTVDAWNPKCIQAGMGAFLRVPFLEIPLDELLVKTQAPPVLGAVMNGASVYEAKLPERGLVVIGQEGRGVSEGALQCINHPVTIPRGPGGGAESLNAAVAAGILAAILHARKT